MGLFFNYLFSKCSNLLTTKIYMLYRVTSGDIHFTFVKILYFFFLFFFFRKITKQFNIIADWSIEMWSLTSDLIQDVIRCKLVLWYLMPISTIFQLWWSVLLVEETRENHQPDASHWQTLSHNVVHLTLSGIQTTHNISGDRHRLHRYM